MKMKHTLLITLSILSLCSCQTKKEQSTDPYNIELVESKKITLPIEDKKEFPRGTVEAEEWSAGFTHENVFIGYG